MPRGASPKREREYRELKHRFTEEGRYKGREEEVASRIVNKQRSQYGETRAEHDKDWKGQSPDRYVPIHDYQHMTVDQVKARLDSLSRSELRQVREYERNHKDRKTLLQELDDRV